MSKKYQRQIIPATSTRIAVEASNSLDLLRFVNSDKHLILLNDFGQSGTKNDVLRHMNFTEEQIKKRILDLLK